MELATTRAQDRATSLLPVTDRAADTWHPLIAVADFLGDEVSDEAREACREIAEIQVGE